MIEIGENAFSECSDLETVYFDSTTAPIIADNAFLDVSSNLEISVPENSSGYDTNSGLNGITISKMHTTVLRQSS